MNSLGPNLKDKLIYVAGHTGMVGSAIVRKLKELGHENFILKTSSELDLEILQPLIYSLKKKASTSLSSSCKSRRDTSKHEIPS